MGAGRRAAKSIATYLSSGKKWPVTAPDVAAFQPQTQLITAATFAGATATGAESVFRTCPKCHQPVEGDEDYICCGTATVQWRCTSCQKVSDGFAFPYGMCPACGGKLEVIAGLNAADAAALEAVRVAFEIELGGMAFYEKAQFEAKDGEMKRLFAKMAEMERGHMATLVRRYHAEVPAPSPTFKTDRAAIYAGIDHKPEDPANLFRIAIAFEQRAVKLFEERAAKASGAEKQLFQELAAEEREHVALLTTELEQWKKGKPGLL
jgi:rubrerythrin